MGINDGPNENKISHRWRACNIAFSQHSTINGFETLAIGCSGWFGRTP